MINLVRCIAKVWSVISIALLLLFFVGEALYPSTPASFTPSELVGLSFFPIGVVLGMIVGWRNEALGGGIALASLVGFYVWCRIVRGRWPGGPFFALIAAPGMLFLAAWVLSRYTLGRRD